MAKSAWILLLFYLLCTTDAQESSCVTFDLEDSVDNVFASDLDCEQFPTFGPWEDAAYDDLDIALDVRGTRYIRPSAAGSCSRTREVFPVVNGGVIEVNCFIQMSAGSSGVGYVNVLAQNYADGTTVGVGVINSNMIGNGMHTLTINDLNVPVGLVVYVYMVLVGAVPPESILLIDSFHYADNEEDTCEIYPDIIPPAPPVSSEEESTSEEGELEPVPDSSPESTQELSSSEEGELEPVPDSSPESTQELSSSEEGELEPIPDSSPESTQEISSSEEGELEPVPDSSPESTQELSSSEEGELEPVPDSSPESTQELSSSEEGELEPVPDSSPESTQELSSSEEGELEPVPDSSPESTQELSSSEEGELEPVPDSSPESTQELSSSEEGESESAPDSSEEDSEEIIGPIYVPVFWNGLTIAAVVVLSIVFISLIAIVAYILGRKSRRKQTAPRIYLQEGELPISYIVPRIPTSYSKNSQVSQDQKSHPNGFSSARYSDRNYLSDEWVGRSYDRNYPRDERSRSPNSDWARQQRESNYPSLEWSRYRDRDQNYQNIERSRGYF